MPEEQAEDRNQPEQDPGTVGEQTSTPEEVGRPTQSEAVSLSAEPGPANDLEDGEQLGAEPLSSAETEALRAGIDQAFRELAESPDEGVSDADSSEHSMGVNDGSSQAQEPEAQELSDAEILELVDQAADAAVPTDSVLPEVAEPEAEAEDDLEILSQDELADLVRSMIAEQGEEIYGGPPETEIAEDPAPFVDASTEPEPVAEVEPAVEVGASSDPDGEESDGSVMTDDDIAALIAQTEALNAPAPAKPEAPAAEKAADEPVPEGILSASQLSSLLGSKDPEGELVPTESSSLDDAELAKLVADAAELEAGLTSQPVTVAEATDAPEVSVAEPEAKVEPQPVPAGPVQSMPSPVAGGSDIGAIRAVPSHLAIRALALPVRFQDGKILCKVAQPPDQVALDRLSRETGLGVIVEPASILDVVKGLRACYTEVQSDSAHLAVLAIAPKKNDFLSMFRRSA